MRKTTLLLLLFAFCSVSHAQIVRGIIQDQKNDSIINFASIYINGTSVGTNSDQNGIFELNISKFSSMPLTVSALGYISVTITDFPKNKPFVVNLTPKVFELKEIVIEAKSHSRERKANLYLFKQEFLGTTSNALSCEIINENDIKFIYDSNDTIKAYATKPLIIINKSLGYKISYFLDKFEYVKSNSTFFFKGNIVFNESQTNDEEMKRSFEKKRKAAYLGSRMHFFRALWQNDLKSSRFLMRNWANEEFNYDSLVTQSENTGKDAQSKFLKCSGGLYITYTPKFGLSRLKLEADSVLFDRYGYYDQLSLSFDGEMAKQRIGDLLPLDYLMEP